MQRQDACWRHSQLISQLFAFPLRPSTILSSQRLQPGMPRSVSSTSPPRSNKSPIRTERRRSRSPQREKDRPRRRDGGFKWKEKRRNDEGEEDREGDRRLERGYREHYRARSPKREQDRDIRERDQERDNQEASRKEKDSKEKKEKKEKKKKKEKQADAVVPSGEAMIIVNVNDRLGTKAAIPCYASDPISQYQPLDSLRLDFD